MNLVILLGLLSLPAAAFPGGAAPRVVRGTVLETLDAGAYTYLRLKTPSGEEWAAVGKTALKKGDKAAVAESTVMEDFDSPALKRRFKKVVFGVLEGGAPAAPAPAAQPARPRPAGPALEVRLAELGKRAKELSGRLVRVSGRVTKYNAKIMGRNWLHLEDGPGTDLTVTTGQAAAKGDRVAAEGVLALDRDFGSGYSYKVLLEDAALKKL